MNGSFPHQQVIQALVQFGFKKSGFLQIMRQNKKLAMFAESP